MYALYIFLLPSDNWFAPDEASEIPDFKSPVPFANAFTPSLNVGTFSYTCPRPEFKALAPPISVPIPSFNATCPPNN